MYEAFSCSLLDNLAENREWQATCTPWPKVPPAVKDVVKCLPTHINMKNLDMEEIKAPRLQEEKRRGLPKSSTCKPYSAKIMQAFSIYDCWSKKLLLPVTTLYAEVPRSLDGGIENNLKSSNYLKKDVLRLDQSSITREIPSYCKIVRAKRGACSLQVE
ncbi:hypothetical protein O6H91_14G027700 [Diphasiastrum complanatum]|uniref:Uncharacterized protein n=1 Tax=Diphasiastrum complanatum TaxID=34168 RepID=A0ACC2BMK7_DIPCM|nr:hypothetical protein O6H91_14G027700 [Diphasiastrum complanatum]